MDQKNPESTLNTHEVAQRCGSSDATVRYAARVGTLRGTKVGRVWQFTESEANSFCADLQARKRRRQMRVTNGRPYFGHIKRAVQGGVALLHITASIVSLVAAGVWDDFAPIGYAIAAWNALAVVYAYIREAWKRPLKGDGEDVDPDVVGLQRSQSAERGERGDDGPSHGDSGVPAHVAPTKVASAALGVQTAMQIGALVAAFAFGAVAANNHDEVQTTPPPPDTSKPFTTCPEWLAGTGLESITLDDDVTRSDASRLVVCSGSYGGITDISELGQVSGDVMDASIFLVFPAPNAAAQNAEPLVVAPEECVPVALPMSGLGGCLSAEQYGVILSVPVRSDLIVEVQVINQASSSTELRRTAEQIVEQVAVNSLA